MGVLSISTVSFEVSIVLKTGSNLLGDLNNHREGRPNEALNTECGGGLS